MVNEHEKLSSSAKALLLDDTNDLFLSVASLWEAAIKVSLGKLTELNGGVEAFLIKIGSMPIELYPITADHVKIVENLPFIHRDPFDRMLVATAIADDMTILTTDPNISKYDISCIW
jgi:PIN domain nuclease of toxin-antitoxin system